MALTVIEIETLELIKRASRKFVESKTKIDWEQRRYEIAKNVISVNYNGESNGNAVFNLKKTDEHLSEMAQTAVKIADALILELKKGGK